MALTKLEIAKNAISVIEKTMPQVKIYNLGETTKDLSVQRVGSGSYKLDEILGGGYPKSRIMEFYGAESSGKTTLALIAAAQVTQAGGIVGFIDAEQALDVEYAKKLGVDMNRFYLVQPGYGEEAFNLLDGFVKSGAFDLVIVDSVSALTPKAVLEGNAEDVAQIGLLARLMSRNLSRTVPTLGQNGETFVIFINQERAKIGGFTPSFGGEPVETTGGKALKFYASIRLEIKKGEPIKRGDERIGTTMRIKTVKNKTCPPFKSTDIKLMYDDLNHNYGIDSNLEVIDLVIDQDILGKSGRYLSLTGQKIQSDTIEGVKMTGSEALAAYLKREENADQLAYLMSLLKSGVTTIVRNEKEECIDFLKTQKKPAEDKKAKEVEVKA